jgi:mediator of RNA polymerase II transcription subunit 16, fungi type
MRSQYRRSPDDCFATTYPGSVPHAVVSHEPRILIRRTDAQIIFVSEAYRALPINCYFTVEQDKFMHHLYILRCLSVQAALSFKDRYSPRGLPATLAWAILHLRHASLLLAYFLQCNKPAKDIIEPQDPGER